jgi:hypothetical protein
MIALRTNNSDMQAVLSYSAIGELEASNVVDIEGVSLDLEGNNGDKALLRLVEMYQDLTAPVDAQLSVRFLQRNARDDNDQEGQFVQQHQSCYNSCHCICYMISRSTTFARE